MGKKSVNRSLRQQLKVIDTLGGQMAREGMADFGVTLSASKAGTANLLRQLGTFERGALGATNRAVNKSLRQYVRGAQSIQGGVRRSQRAIAGRYGPGTAGYAGTVMAPARTKAREAVKVQKALQAQGRTGTATGQMVADVAREGAVAQQAAAEYALAQALQQRTIIDNQTLAQMTGDAYKMAFQYNAEWSMWKRQQDYAKKLAEEDEETAMNGSQLEALGNTFATISQDAMAWHEQNLARPEITEEMSDEERAMGRRNLTTMATRYAKMNAYAPDSDQVAMFLSIQRNLQQGLDPGAASQQAFRELYGGSAGFDKWGEKLLTAMPARVDFEAHARALQTLLTEQPPEEEEEREGGTYLNRVKIWG